MIDLRHAFGFSGEPFPQDLAVDQLFARPGLDALLDRFHYTIELGMLGAITGQVGSGKSTSLRCAASRLHPSAFRLLSVLASAGTYMELLRGIAAAAGLQHRVTSTVTLTTTIRDHLTDIRAKKQTPLLIIDEAHLMRLDVFAQLHTLTQFQFDSQSLMPVVELTRFRGHIESEHERRDLPWRERIKRTHLSSASRWSSWCSLGGRRTNWLGSTRLQPGLSATGWPRVSATQDSATTV